MGGKELFSGSTYQERVIAFVCSHILAGHPLGWLHPEVDTPISVSAETGGPGDDFRVGFGDRLSPIEVQAKRSLPGGKKLAAELNSIASRSRKCPGVRVIIAVGRRSSRTIYEDFANDLNRLRSGRRDGLKKVTLTALVSLNQDYDLLECLFVVPIYLDNLSDPEFQNAELLLGSILEDPSQVRAAWSVFIDDCGRNCAEGLKRTRKDLVDILAAANIIVKPLRKDDVWHQKLDFNRELLGNGNAQAALKRLSQFENELRDSLVDPHVRYRLACRIGF